MLNYATIIGRLVQDPKLQQTEGGEPFIWFQVAVERDHPAPGEPECDYIVCVAHGHVVKFISSYFKQGKPIVLEGRLENFPMIGVNGKRLLGLQLNVTNARFQESSYPPQKGTRSGNGFQRKYGYR